MAASSRSTSPLVAPGAIVASKYRLEQLLGQGGMGSVWVATHVGLGRAVALKFISPAYLDSEDARRRFDAEARAAAVISSRHVTHIYDSGNLEDGTPFIAMELLRGETLQGRVERAGPLSLVDTVSIVEQACTGLAAAHSLGIVHRDIKPDNLFLATEQDGYIVKLLDFGIAKVAGVESESFSATRTGTVLGTPLFMSPEQVRGLRSTDLRTDLYSLAVTTYFSVTGELPFSGESFGDILLLICTASLPVPSATAPWLPPSFDAWFAKAAARDPFDRFQSAGALADALRLTTKGPAGASASSSAKSGVGDSEAQASAHPTGAAAGRQAPSASSTAGPPTWQALSESLPLGLRGSAEVLRGLMTPWFSSCSPVAPNVVRLEGPRVPHVRSLASYAVLMGADAAGANRVGTHTFMTFVTPLERHLE